MTATVDNLYHIMCTTSTKSFHKTNISFQHPYPDGSGMALAVFDKVSYLSDTSVKAYNTVVPVILHSLLPVHRHVHMCWLNLWLNLNRPLIPHMFKIKDG